MFRKRLVITADQVRVNSQIAVSDKNLAQDGYDLLRKVWRPGIEVSLGYFNPL